MKVKFPFSLILLFLLASLPSLISSFWSFVFLSFSLILKWPNEFNIKHSRKSSVFKLSQSIFCVLYWRRIVLGKRKKTKIEKKTTVLISGMLLLWFCDEESTSNKREPQHEQGCESMRETCKNKLPSIMKTCLTQWHLEQILYSNKSDASQFSTINIKTIAHERGYLEVALFTFHSYEWNWSQSPLLLISTAVQSNAVQ